MKKQIISKSLMACVAVSLLAGCTKSDVPADVPADDPVNEPVPTQSTDEYVFEPSVSVAEKEGYTYNAEEIMYLAGITLTKYDDNKKFSLYDTDGDFISELFVSVTTDGNEKIGVYKYDEAANCASLTEGVEYDPKALVWASEEQWPDSSIIGVADILGDPGIATDFYASVNYDTLTGSYVKSQGLCYDPLDMKSHIDEQKRNMLMDTESYQGEDVQILRDYYNAATDWDKRNEEGVEPVRKYIDAVLAIKSLDDVTKYLIDTEKNPFNKFMGFDITLNDEDTAEWVLTIQEDNFSVIPRIYHNSDDEDIKDVRQDFDSTVRYVLGRLDYPDDEIEKILADAYEIEDVLLENAWPDEEDFEKYLGGFVSYEEVIASCENFPMKRLLNTYNVDGGNLNLIYPGYLPALDGLYTADNVDKLKAYLLTHLINACRDYLDYDTAVCLGDFGDSEEDNYKFLNNSIYLEVTNNRGMLSAAEENAYITCYVDEDVKKDLTDLAVQIRDTYRDMLKDEEWLSDEGKKAAIEKLDTMQFCVLSPDELIDSSYLKFDNDLCFLDIYATVCVNTLKHNLAYVGEERIPGEWRYDLLPSIATSVDNAYYNGTLNQFFILEGFVTDDTYRVDMTPEEKLGMFGPIIAHELTHGFDPMGIRYDKDGNKVGTDENPIGWMPQKDYDAFMDRAKSVASYFDNIVYVPYMACTGEYIWGEATADIGGMAIMLNIAKTYDDFDYDAFFKNRAKFWVQQSTLIKEQGDINDPHPAVYLRVNTVLQQFDEFYETYGIKEGDMMYLAPEGRINIW